MNQTIAKLAYANGGSVYQIQNLLSIPQNETNTSRKGLLLPGPVSLLVMMMMKSR
jgi:hypothetical protein